MRGFGGDPQASIDALKAAGVNAAFFVSPLTAHEFQSWRRSVGGILGPRERVTAGEQPLFGG